MYNWLYVNIIQLKRAINKSQRLICLKNNVNKTEKGILLLLIAWHWRNLLWIYWSKGIYTHTHTKVNNVLRRLLSRLSGSIELFCIVPNIFDWRMSTDFTKIIVKHLHFLPRENETKLSMSAKLFSLHRQTAPLWNISTLVYIVYAASCVCGTCCLITNRNNWTSVDPDAILLTSYWSRVACIMHRGHVHLKRPAFYDVSDTPIWWCDVIDSTTLPHCGASPLVT